MYDKEKLDFKKKNAPNKSVIGNNVYYSCYLPPTIKNLRKKIYAGTIEDLEEKYNHYIDNMLHLKSNPTVSEFYVWYVTNNDELNTSGREKRCVFINDVLSCVLGITDEEGRIKYTGKFCDMKCKNVSEKEVAILYTTRIMTREDELFLQEFLENGKKYTDMPDLTDYLQKLIGSDKEELIEQIEINGRDKNITKDELDRIHYECLREKPDGGVMHGRAGLAIAFIIETGMPIQEVKKLKINQLKEEENTLGTKTKYYIKMEDGRKYPISHKLYKKITDNYKVNENRYIFTTRPGSPIETQHLIKCMNKVLEFSGSRSMTLSDIRFAYGKELILDGVPFPQIAKILGYTNIRSLELAYKDIIKDKKRLDKKLEEFSVKSEELSAISRPNPEAEKKLKELSINPKEIDEELRKIGVTVESQEKWNSYKPLSFGIDVDSKEILCHFDIAGLEKFMKQLGLFQNVSESTQKLICYYIMSHKISM